MKSFLNELASNGIRYALIRDPNTNSEKGDIDVLIKDIDKFISLSEDIGCINFSNKEGNFKYLKYDSVNKKWIHIDIYTKFDFNGIYPPSSFYDYLIKSAISDNDNIFRIDKNNGLLLLLLHTSLNKNGFNPRHLELFKQANLEILESLKNEYAFLPRPLSEYISLVHDLNNGVIKECDVVKFIQKSFPKLKKKKQTLFFRLYRRLSFYFGRSQSIVFLGPDGAGKTTITEAISKLQWPRCKRQFMGPGRKSEIIPLLYTSLNYLHNVRSNYPKNSLFGLLSRVGWQMICYFDLNERLLRHKLYMAKGGVVIFDRFACDMYFRKPTKINELLFFKYFPKPKYVYLCVGSENEIHSRKPELSKQEIKDTIILYRDKLKQYNIEHIEINTTAFDQNKSINLTVKHLIDANWHRK